MYQPSAKGEMLLDCKFRGGERPTNELDGKKYLTDVGTCWDFDLVTLKKCGCRLFKRSSICCRKGGTKQCGWRVGDSELVDCTKYGKPKFGLSGNTEPEECASVRTGIDCAKRNDLVFGQGATIGPCTGSPNFTCPKGQETVQAFWDRKCGATPEDCGCKVVKACSKKEHLDCYRAYKNDKEALACYNDPKHKSNYDRWFCYDELKKARANTKAAKE